MKWPSRYVVKRTATVTLIAAAISISFSTGIRLIVGSKADAITIAVRLVLPFLIAIPLGLVWFSRLEKLDLSYHELLKKTAELAKSAATDPLTGLLNRRSFGKQFELALAHEVPGHFLIADVDRLKAINDQFGHLAGDDAIVSIATALQKALPEQSLIARVGGDEFCAFIPQRDGFNVEGVIANINQIANHEFSQTDSTSVGGISVSVGHIMCKGSMTLTQAIAQADKRMYQRKSSRAERKRLADAS